jgi:hypothetical protein
MADSGVNGCGRTLLRTLHVTYHIRCIPSLLYVLRNVHLEPRIDPAGVERCGVKTFQAISPIYLRCEINVGCLRLAIRFVRLITIPILPIEVVIEANGAIAVAEGGYGDDTGVERGCGGFEEGGF